MRVNPPLPPPEPIDFDRVFEWMVDGIAAKVLDAVDEKLRRAIQKQASEARRLGQATGFPEDLP